MMFKEIAKRPDVDVRLVSWIDGLYSGNALGRVASQRFVGFVTELTKIPKKDAILLGNTPVGTIEWDVAIVALGLVDVLVENR